MVMGRDSRSKDCGFKSRHRILDGHFFTYICCKNCNVCLKRPKINEKEPVVGPFNKKQLHAKNNVLNWKFVNAEIEIFIVSFLLDCFNFR